MSYYMGDFYRGDPGIGSFFGGLVKKAVGFIPGVGPALSAIMPGGGAAVAARLPVAASVTQAAKSVAGRVSTAIVKHPVLSAAGAAGALGGMGAGVEALMSGGGCRPGHRSRPVLKKCGQPLKHGGCGKCHRSMNVCNPRALRRAIRRTRGFAKLAMKSIHIIHPKKKGRFGGFKARRRK